MCCLPDYLYIIQAKNQPVNWPWGLEENRAFFDYYLLSWCMVLKVPNLLRWACRLIVLIIGEERKGMTQFRLRPPRRCLDLSFFQRLRKETTLKWPLKGKYPEGFPSHDVSWGNITLCYLLFSDSLKHPVLMYFVPTKHPDDAAQKQEARVQSRIALGLSP